MVDHEYSFLSGSKKWEVQVQVGASEQARDTALTACDSCTHSSSLLSLPGRRISACPTQPNPVQTQRQTLTLTQPPHSSPRSARPATRPFQCCCCNRRRQSKGTGKGLGTGMGLTPDQVASQWSVSFRTPSEVVSPRKMDLLRGPRASVHTLAEAMSGPNLRRGTRSSRRGVE